ncbi:MAG: hypothetical protein K0S73_2178 [Stenotrophomonas rhizophila]|jgi:hypothetical protein|uniref:hypothetical protein n=1 Tax=Stenotrophomonas TaxID=40323 RepID=UPI003012F83C|nr:hypothetical protein [Stenotrophomonas rhizophila]
MKRVILAAGTAALLLALGAAQAAPNEEVFARNKPLAEQIQRIEVEMGDGKTYSELRLEDRSRVREALSRMHGVLDQYPDQATLPEPSKIALFNDQQIVNTILTKAREDSRQVCVREKTTGSHRATTQCMTVAQRQRAKDDAQKNLTNAQRTGQSIF